MPRRADPVAAADASAWPEALDALNAAPLHHSLMFEDERVRVLDTHIPAGDRTPVHTHRWPAVMVVLQWSPFVRYAENGDVQLDSRRVPTLAVPTTVLPSAPLPPHSLENVGTADLHIISVELKD